MVQGAGAPLLKGGTGLLVYSSAGVAGFLSGTVGAGAGGGFDISADALLRVNTTGGSVHQSLVLDGRTVEVPSPAPRAPSSPSR